MEKPSLFILQRDIKDLERYIERAERDPILIPPGSLDHKKKQLENAKEQLMEHYSF